VDKHTEAAKRKDAEGVVQWNNIRSHEHELLMTTLSELARIYKEAGLDNSWIDDISNNWNRDEVRNWARRVSSYIGQKYGEKYQ